MMYIDIAFSAEICRIVFSLFLKGVSIKLMKKNSYKPPRDSADIATNVIITAVIVAVLAAGAYAVYPRISESIQNNSGSSENAINTAADAAKDKGMSFNEFIETYGLDKNEIKKDTELADTMKSMTLEKVALYNDVEIDEFRASNFVPESVTNDTKWGDIIPQLPLKAVVGGEETANQIISVYGLDGKLTIDTPWSEAEPIMNAARDELMQAQANAEAAEKASAEPSQADASSKPADASTSAPTAMPTTKASE